MTEQLAIFRTPRTLWRRSYFGRHLVEMFLAMWIGMPLGRSLFAAVYGSGSNEAVQQHDVAWTLLMAFAMAAPMVALMLYRRHGLRSAVEMAAVMIAPALPFVALKLGHVVTWQVAGPYMSASMVAMIALIVYRRSDYRMAAAAHA